MQSSDNAVTVNGSLLKRKMTLKKIPVRDAVPMARRRKIRNGIPGLMARILGSVKKSANGPEKRIFPIMTETTNARDSMALLSNIARWSPLVI